MKFKTALYITVCVLGLNLVLSTYSKSSDTSNATSSDAIKWVSYEDGIALAKKEEKKIFLNFYTDWCHYCKKMQKETFLNSHVIDYLNKNFVSIKVNPEKEQLADKYPISGFPTNIFLSKSGKIIGYFPGYAPPDLFLKTIKNIQQNER